MQNQTTTTSLGNIGEAAAKLLLLKQGYEIYSDSGNNYFDILAYDPVKHKVKRVEVKTTKTRNESNTGWMVRCKKKEGRYGKDIPFDNKNTDLLIVFIEPLGKLKVFKGKDIKDKCFRFSVFDKELES